MMTHRQLAFFLISLFIAFGYGAVYWQHIIGRTCAPPKPNLSMYGSFNQDVLEIFGSIPDRRQERADCLCDFLASCEHCCEPKFDEAGRLTVNLHHINGNSTIKGGLVALIRSTNCEVVHLVGAESNILRRDLEEMLDYYSGPEFLVVIQDWQRIAADNRRFRREIESRTMLKKLLRHPDWRTQLLACSDSYAVGCAMVACSQVMLPYWDAHCMTDDGFGKTVSAMVEWVARPSDESRARVADCLAGIAVVRIPDRVEYTYLSMPRDEWWPPWPEPNLNTAPGEHAGNSIVSAANYICEIDKPHATQCSDLCLDSGLTAMSHAMGERIHEGTESDIWVLAVDRLRREILEHLKLLRPRSA